MKKVIAYKAFNGKLFDSKEKCLAYETKMAEYPKTTVEETKNGYCDIVHRVVIVKDKPYSQRKTTEDYYIVGGKYKFIGCDKDDMMCNLHDSINAPCFKDVYSISREFAILILRGISINKKVIEFSLQKYKDVNKYSRLKIVKMSEDETMFEITDIRWYAGSIKPFLLRIEKI